MIDPMDGALADPLSGVGDDEEMALVIEMRDRQTDQRTLRAKVLTDLGERVEVRCRLHLLDAESEAMLLAHLREHQDRLAVMRHVVTGSVDEDQLAADRDELERRVVELTAQVDAVVVELAVAIGRPPRGGADWSSDDVPANALEEIARAWAMMRRELVRVTEHLVASDLVRVVETRTDGAVDVVLREHDAESAARVRAFVEEARWLDDLACRCAERVRRIALRAANAQPRSWLAQNQLRSRQAREALDMVRAVHAARAELEMIARSG